jgi:metallophosphoesterase superfamily enzyme
MSPRKAPTSQAESFEFARSICDKARHGIEQLLLVDGALTELKSGESILAVLDLDDERAQEYLQRHGVEPPPALEEQVHAMAQSHPSRRAREAATKALKCVTFKTMEAVLVLPRSGLPKEILEMLEQPSPFGMIPVLVVAAGVQILSAIDLRPSRATVLS